MLVIYIYIIINKFCFEKKWYLIFFFFKKIFLDSIFSYDGLILNDIGFDGGILILM